jgi:hypothetical protein
MLFVDFAKSMRISTSVETFAEHLEAYAGVPTLLIKTDDNTVRHLEAKFAPKASEEVKETPVATEEVKTETPVEPEAVKEEEKPAVEEEKPAEEHTNVEEEKKDETTDNHE